VRPRYPQALLLTAPTAFQPSGKTPLLLAQVSQAGVIALGIEDLSPVESVARAVNPRSTPTTRCVIGSSEVWTSAQKLTW
jgi:hypothetical protein